MPDLAQTSRWLLVLTMASSCASTGLIGDARVLKPGRVQVAVEPGIALDHLEIAWGPNPPLVAAVGRVGLPAGVDVGLRVFTAGAYLEGRFQAQGSDGSAGTVDTLVGLRGGARGSNVCREDVCGVQPVASFATYSATGINVTKWLSLIIGVQALVDANRETFRLSAGGNVAVRVRLTDWLGLMPEYSIVLPLLPVPFPLLRHEAGLAVILTFPAS